MFSKFKKKYELRLFITILFHLFCIGNLLAQRPGFSFYAGSGMSIIHMKIKGDYFVPQHLLQPQWSAMGKMGISYILPLREKLKMEFGFSKSFVTSKISPSSKVVEEGLTLTLVDFEKKYEFIEYWSSSFSFLFSPYDPKNYFRIGAKASWYGKNYQLVEIQTHRDRGLYNRRLIYGGTVPIDLVSHIDAGLLLGGGIQFAEKWGLELDYYLGLWDIWKPQLVRRTTTQLALGIRYFLRND